MAPLHAAHPIKDPLKRDFYAAMCLTEGLSARELRRKIDRMLHRRTALSKKPEEFICKELAALHEKDELTPALVFRDPYMLDSPELADTCSEKDLESAILREIEHFLLERGASPSLNVRAGSPSTATTTSTAMPRPRHTRRGSRGLE